MDPATLRHAKEKAALSRKELEQEQQKHRGTKPATVRIWATQRKIAKAEWKLECLQVQRKDLRKKFDEEDGGLEERELEWQQKLQSLRDQLYEGCDEVVVARAKDSLQVDAARTTQGIDDAGYALQELLSRIDDEETRGIVAGMSKSLEDAKEASERLAQWDSKRDKKPKLEERRGGNEVESERKEAEMGEKEAVAPPAHWMQPTKSRKKMGDEDAEKGKGSGKKKWAGNVARQFADAQEAPSRMPSHEEEVEMARRAVSAIDDKYKGQQLTAECKRKLLEEAMQEMAGWISRGGARLHAASTAGEHLVCVATGKMQDAR